ncbi:MAG: ABC transporter ATP-binding protein [Brevinema sp.]
MKHVIKADNINLTYEIGQGLSLKKLFTRSKQNLNVSKIHAIKDLSFTLDEGYNLGIIGSNGSGKSTLMRIISQTYTPDTGHLSVNAESVSLLALGAGFMPELTGRDNIYLNALLLGIKKETLDNGLAEEIIAFSEIGDFVDYPMNTYSSGMISRLMFSVAVCVSPDLLLIDEVLSVGDAHFVDKSKKKVKELIESKRSVVLISHDNNAILTYCDKVMWMEKGVKKMFGGPKEVLNEYLDFIGAPKI